MLINSIETQDALLLRKMLTKSTNFIHTGITSHTFTLELQIARQQIVYETVDNIDIICRIRELYKENQSHFEDTTRWLKTLKKCDYTNGSRIDEIVAIRNMLQGMLSKFTDLDIREEEFSFDENEDGEEFEEVPEKLPRFDIEDEEEISDAVGVKMEVSQSLQQSNVATNDDEQPTCSRCKYVLSYLSDNVSHIVWN